MNIFLTQKLVFILKPIKKRKGLFFYRLLYREGSFPSMADLTVTDC